MFLLNVRIEQMFHAKWQFIIHTWNHQKLPPEKHSIPGWIFVEQRQWFIQVFHFKIMHDIVSITSNTTDFIEIHTFVWIFDM